MFYIFMYYVCMCIGGILCEFRSYLASVFIPSADDREQEFRDLQWDMS